MHWYRMTDISNEDALLWQQTVSDVSSLKTDVRITSPVSKKKKSVKKDITSVYQNFHHDVKLNTSADIDKQTLKRFKKEEFGVEASLDLHGFTVDSAFKAVNNFILSSYHTDKRAVLIITGKGLPHKEQDIFEPKGSLRQSVPLWLQSDVLSPMILTFIHPSQKLGGTGALYILLRRRR